MKRRIYVAGLAGIMLFATCGNMFAPAFRKGPTGPIEGTVDTRPAWQQKPKSEWTQKDAEDYFRSHYKQQAKIYISDAKNLVDLQSGWSSVANSVRNKIMDLSAQFPELPAQDLYNEAIKYMTDLYNQQAKVIESFKEPTSPWEQQQGSATI